MVRKSFCVSKVCRSGVGIGVAILLLSGVLIESPCGGAEASVTSLRHQASKQLRLESVAKTPAAKDTAAAALCDLYVVLRSDARYPNSDMLQGDAAKVRRRLLSIARRREIQLGRQGIAKPAGLSGRVESAIEESLSDDDREGTPVGTSAAGPAIDNGWGLVELIQRVVAPDFWESTGGTGSIQYFAMRRVLVVRATSDVHQQVKDLLMALR